jgi:two-component system LytT family sensor kinase
MKLLLSLAQAMSVFLVVGYVYCKSPAFKPLKAESLRARDRLYLYVFFSALSILGTYLGLPVQGAIANTRAIGPVLAGIIGGPLLGTAVGLTGGLHRFLLGGFTAFSCGVSTTVEGLMGGLVGLYLVRRKAAERIFDPWVALFTTVASEAAQMALILLISRPYSDALSLVRVIAFPMIAANSIGAALFMSVIRDRRNMYDTVGAQSSAKALRIAERTLSLLSRGFSSEMAPEMARIIHQETGVGAVAITDTEKVLAFVGEGADHHLAGGPIASALTARAIAQNEVVFADGLREQFICSVSPSCPLASALVVPLQIDGDVIGTVKLYEPRNKLFRNVSRTLGEGITGLLSNQLLLSRYQEQKNLLVMAELKLIQAQVNPHFLFNSLNTIIAVTRTDAERAKELLIHLSNFFRKNLKRVNELSTLEEELDHVFSYLEIEKARFQDRLVVATEVDPSLLQLRIPTFTLQPLIENAVKHGISAMLGPGAATIRAYRSGAVARIEIEDNAGTWEERGPDGGLGMRIVDKRIKNLLGSNFGISVSCVPHQLTRVSIQVPAEGSPA